jgi:hypothetical protein
MLQMQQQMVGSHLLWRVLLKQPTSLPAKQQQQLVVRRLLARSRPVYCWLQMQQQQAARNLLL